MSIESKFPNVAALKIALNMDMDKMLEWSFSQMEKVLDGDDSGGSGARMS